MTAAMTRPTPWRGIIAQYGASLPVPEGVPVVTLGEGGTPLLPAPVLSELTGCAVYLKVEGMNPTGSFKDRGMTVAVTLAAARGAHTVICASTGNTSASAAAYAARAGLGCAVLVPEGQRRARQAGPGARARRPATSGRRQLRRLPRARAQACRRLPGRAGELGQPRAAPGPEDGVLRGGRRSRRCAGRALPAGRQRRQHRRLLARLPGVPGRRPGDEDAADARLPGSRRCPDRPRPAGARAGHRRHRHPDRQPRVLAAGRGSASRVRRPDRRR